MTTSQRIYVGHEVRMWIMGVGLPLLGIAVLLATNPYCQQWIREKKFQRSIKQSNKKKRAK